MPNTSWTNVSNPSTTWTKAQIVGLGYGKSPYGRYPYGDPHPNPEKGRTGYDALWTKVTHPSSS